MLLYALLFAAGFLENIVPPAPSDTVMLFGAYLVAKGVLNFPLVYAATTAGSVAGFITLFLAAKHFGRSWFLQKNYRFFPATLILRGEQLLKGHAYTIVLCNRFLPGLRSVISIAAGFLHLHTFFVAVLSVLGSAAWNFIWIYAGFKLGKNWDQVLENGKRLLSIYNKAALVVFFVVVACFVFLWKRRNRRN